MHPQAHRHERQAALICASSSRGDFARPCGKIEGAATKAVSPNGGLVISAVVLSDPEKGKFALKDKDAAMAAGFAHLRSKGAFPDDDGDDSDDMVFGDDDNLDDYA